MSTPFTQAYKRYALAALTTAYAVNLFDRGLMFLLLQPIKEDLHLSDTQLGFVTGIAFAAFYATLGVPIARWADRGNRITITSLAMALWGVTAIGCAFVTNYVQFLLARIAAGIGDAGCQPPVYSLIGDYFPQAAERTRALYIWQVAIPLSGMVVFMGGGWVNEAYGWRSAFLGVGIVGLLLSVLIKWTLIEPRQRAGIEQERPAALPLKAVLMFLWRQLSCRHLTLSSILLFMVGQGAGSWQAAFMMRQHGIGTAELGVWMALIYGVGGIASLALGSYVVSRWLIDDERAQMRLLAGAVALAGAIFVAFLMVPTQEQALSALLLQTLVHTGSTALFYVMMQRLVPAAMRATALMVILLLGNLIGMGIGPLMVGTLSDVMAPRFGNDALRYAMMFVSVLWLWAAYHLLRVSRTIKEDLKDPCLAQAD